MGARKRLAAEARKEKNKQLCIAHLNNNNTSPRKTRLMADLIRGKEVEYAFGKNPQVIVVRHCQLAGEKRERAR